MTKIIKVDSCFDCPYRSDAFHSGRSYSEECENSEGCGCLLDVTEYVENKTIPDWCELKNLEDLI